MQSAVPPMQKTSKPSAMPMSAVPEQLDPKSENGWYAFDLDGTLATYDGWKGVQNIGGPLGPDDPQSAFSLAKQKIAAGEDVRIFTARVAEGKEAIAPIEAWCQQNFGKVLPVTNQKNLKMLRLYDDLASSVDSKTGRVMGLGMKSNTGMPVR